MTQGDIFLPPSKNDGLPVAGAPVQPILRLLRNAFGKQFTFAARFNASLIFYSLFLISNANAQIDVPTEKCMTEWSQTNSVSPPNTKTYINFSYLNSNKLAVYISQSGILLGPRGWRCVENGNASLVSIRIFPDLTKYSDVGISIQIWVGENPSRNIDIIKFSGRYFPSVVSRSYVTKLLNDDPDLLAEKKQGIDFFLIRAYQNDRIHYLNNSELYFITPSGKQGLGSLAFNNTRDITYGKNSSFETSGIFCLINEPRKAYKLLIYSVRMPNNFRDLLKPIEEYKKIYFRNLDAPGC